MDHNMDQDRKTYTREDALKATQEYFGGDSLAADVWVNKYALKDSAGNLYERTPDDMHHRLSREIARIEAKYPNPMSEEEIFELLNGFKHIVPQGGPMTGIGNDYQVTSLSNCFVVGNENDSYGGILKTEQEQIQLMKRRGGVGHDLSHIRPKGTPVKNSALTSTGIVPFMERFSNATREVAQDGRRGALMLSISSRHMEAEAFIDAKLTEGKVTGANVSVKIDDEFMRAVIDGRPYEQRFPVDSDNPKVRKEVDPRGIWKKIIHNAWKSAEPGVLFWDTIIRESVSDCYADLGYKTMSTNPCVVGDTLVAVADGRGTVPIRDLAASGDDVPVYTVGDDGKLTVRIMRNPRLTGTNNPVYKVTLDSGDEIRVTGNHKFLLTDGRYVETTDLVEGDSLRIMTRYIAPVVGDNGAGKSDYVWYRYANRNHAEHRLIYEHHNDTKIIPGYVVHHDDRDSMNNQPKNLKLMSKDDHDKLHVEKMMGKNNPFFRMTDEWKERFFSIPTSGECNGRYTGHSHDELRKHAILLTEKIGHRFSKKDWQEYAKENGLPVGFSKWRNDHLNGGLLGLAKWAAHEIGYENVDVDPRLAKRYYELLSKGYDCRIEDGDIIFTKKCEVCGREFESSKRESGVCSSSCSGKRNWRDESIRERMLGNMKSHHDIVREKNTEEQLRVYTDLKFGLGSHPSRHQWEEVCKISGITSDLRKSASNVNSYRELVETAASFNHRVVSVVIDGNEDVYNGTVDEYHNFFVGGFREDGIRGDRLVFLNNLNCGELPLNIYSACILLAVNLFGYVRGAFVEGSEFDFVTFKVHAAKAQRILDDIIDLELEKIDDILGKIDTDPEPDSVKIVERELWTKIRNRSREGRRIGVGVTAEADMLAALGIRYGTPEATAFSEKVHRELALAVYRSSVELAGERGAFEVFDFKREENNPFLTRLYVHDPELKRLTKKNGRRNIGLLTVAPTGTVSIETQTSSGIEPVFSPAYRRRRKINPSDRGAVVSFVDDMGDSWEEYTVFHPKFVTWLEIYGYNVAEVKTYTQEKLDELVAKSPYYLATAMHIDWKEKVRLQGAVQKYVDASISVTINLPNQATEETVDELYRLAWESGCKGVTVYRDGSRQGVLISSKKKEASKPDIFTENHAPKRPKAISCDIMRFTNRGEKWIAVLGLMDNRPYELFTGLMDSFYIPAYVVSGKIAKERGPDGRSRYDLVYTDQDGYQVTMQGINRAFNREYWNIGKMISGILRHGMPIPNVLTLVDSLNLDGDLIGSWKSGVKRMLKKYIKDGTKIEGQVCPECGSALLYIERCVRCSSCPYSKCE